MNYKIAGGINYNNTSLKGISAKMEIEVDSMMKGEDIQKITEKWEEIEAIIKKYGVAEPEEDSENDS